MSRPVSTIMEPQSISDIFSSPPIIVKVGAERKAYYILKVLIMRYSCYFRAAFGGDRFEEGTSGEISLSDVEPYVFEPFIEWLYTQQLPELSKWPRKYNTPKECTAGRSLANLYVFADRFLVPELKKLVMQMTVSLANSVGAKELPKYDTICFLYDSLPEDDHYIQLLVDVHCCSWTPELHEEKMARGEDINKLPVHFYLKAMSTYAKMIRIKDRTKLFVVENYLKDGE